MSLERSPRFYLRAVALGLVPILLALIGASDARHYFDLIGLLLVLVPIAVISGICWFRHQVSPSTLAYALGVPMGLVWVCFGIVSVFSGMSDLQALAPVTTILLTTALYGGVVSGLGYLWDDSKGVETPAISTGSAIVCAIPLALTFVMGNIGSASNYGALTEELALMIALITILSLTVSSDKPKPKAVAEVTIFSILILSLIGIMDLATIGSDTGFTDSQAYMEGMSRVFFGMNIGLILYIFTIIWALHSGVFDSIDYGQMNWHLVEAFSLLTLITIAPPSLYHFFD